MPKTFADLKEDVARALEPFLGQLNGDEIGAAVNDAIYYHSADSFWFLDTVSVGLIMVVGEPKTALPTDFAALDHLVVQRDNDENVLEAASFENIRRLQDSNHRSEPWTYAIRGLELWWYPIPSEPLGYTLYYRRRLPVLANDDDTNAWLELAPQLIRWAAIAQLAITPLGLPDDQVQRWLGLAEREKHRLMVRHIDIVLPTFGMARPF